MIKCTGWVFLYANLTCTAPPTPVLDTFCMTSRPILWHSKDTRKTKEQVDIHNRKWKKLCMSRAGR